MTELEQLRKNIITVAMKVNSVTQEDITELEKAYEALEQYKLNHPEEFLTKEENNDDDFIEEEMELMEESMNEDESEKGWERDIWGNSYYAGIPSWEEQAFKDSGMTWKDFA